jgi:hypothetical protein
MTLVAAAKFDAGLVYQRPARSAFAIIHLKAAADSSDARTKKSPSMLGTPM